MPRNPNNASRQQTRQAQQAQQRFHRHNQQFAKKQMQGLTDQWRARQAHLGAQVPARQQQDDALAQRDNAPRYRGEGWSSDLPDPIGSEVSSSPPAPRQRSGAGGRSGVFVGEARNIDRTQEQGGLNYQRTFQVLTFRVDCRDSVGNLQQSVQVRLRGQRIVGNVREGERVEVRGRPGRGGVVQVGSFWNVATQSNVTSGGLFNFTGGGLGRKRGGIAAISSEPTPGEVPFQQQRTPPPPQGSGMTPTGSGAPSLPRTGRVGQFVVLIGAVAFTASVTLLTNYINNGNGGKSLLEATSGDLASPLYPRDFWILIALVALISVATAMGVRAHKRWLMIVAALASAGLIGYTLHIPQIGLAPGFGPYGSSYWLSLVAAVAMALGAVVAAAVRSDY
jgi:hypothetical protein